jgi:hypothetical protein
MKDVRKVAGDMEQLEEDVAMLRQILDNLLAFSQEEVMNQFRHNLGRQHLIKHSARFKTV